MRLLIFFAIQALIQAVVPQSLGEAVVKGDITGVRRRLEEGDEIHPSGPWSERVPLLDAIDKDHMSVYRQLVLHGADVNREAHSTMPLVKAIHNKKPIETIREILDNAACIDDGTCVPLLTAVYAARVEALHELLHRGANLEYLDGDGRSLLWWAIEFREQDMAMELIRAGVSVLRRTATTQSVLVKAIDRGWEDVASMIIDAGADVNDTDERGRSPLMAAYEKKLENVVKRLIDNGADVSADEERRGIPPSLRLRLNSMH